MRGPERQFQLSKDRKRVECSTSGRNTQVQGREYWGRIGESDKANRFGLGILRHMVINPESRLNLRCQFPPHFLITTLGRCKLRRHHGTWDSDQINHQTN